MLPSQPPESTSTALSTSQAISLNTLPAKTGALWVKQGIQTFFKQPLALGGLFFMFMALISVFSLIPVIGGALALVVLPAATVGLMTAARTANEGTFPMPTTLFAAFRVSPAKTRSILILGVLYALGFLAMLGISALFDGGKVAGMYLGGEPMTKELMMDADVQLATWAAMVLYLPLSLMFWHAPALVHWHDITPVKALFFSFIACIRNFAAFVVYFLGWLGVFIIGGMLMTLLAVVTGSESLVSVVMLPVALLMATMFFCSIFFTVRDCFQPK